MEKMCIWEEFLWGTNIQWKQRKAAPGRKETGGSYWEEGRGKRRRLLRSPKEEG